MRLQKYLALCGIASRRNSAKMIESGRIKVNGKVVLEKGYGINEDKDIVIFDDKKIEREKKIYIILNKPGAVLCSRNDPWKRKTIYDIVNINNARLFSIGRLDYESCGLLILTNDGDFAHRVLHPSNKIIKEYYIQSKDIIPDFFIENFKNGIEVDAVFYKAMDIKRISNTELVVLLHEGKKREIRIVCKKFSININILRRIGIGNLKLETLELNEGEYKYISLKKIYQLIFFDK